MIGRQPTGVGAYRNSVSTVAGKYRRVEVALPRSVNGGTDVAIDALNQRFHADDFYVVCENGGLEIWLRQVNINDLGEAIDRVGSEHGAQDALQEVYRAVQNIRSYGINGNKRLYVGYNAERKVVGRKEKVLRRGKHFYANDHDFMPAHNQLPAEFTDSIVCGDSQEVLKALPDNCVDLVFTSPPYNFGLGYEEGDDAADWQAYFDKLFAVFDECIRVLKYGGRIVVNVQPLFSDYIPSHHIVSNYFMDRRLIWKGEILWEKNNYNCKYTAWGSWKSPSSPYLKYTWEFLEVFCKGDLKKVGESANADIDADQFKEWVLAKWSIAPERQMREFGHPAMFPEELAKRVMLLFSFRGDIVLDPFNGVGTTSVVARQNGRRYLGVDVAAEYCAAAEARLSDTQLSGLL